MSNSKKIIGVIGYAGAGSVAAAIASAKLDSTVIKHPDFKDKKNPFHKVKFKKEPITIDPIPPKTNFNHS